VCEFAGLSFRGLENETGVSPAVAVVAPEVELTFLKAHTTTIDMAINEPRT
jgi:hypothetical protein